MSHTVESISAILLKSATERTKCDYEDMHMFMKENVKIFKGDKGAKKFMQAATGDGEAAMSYQDAMNLY